MTAAHDDRLERWVGIALRTGVTISTVLLASGLALQLAGVAPGVSSRLLRSGIFTLMVTPIARVVISVVDYALQRDWVFLALTGTVLTVLLVSFFVS